MIIELDKIPLNEFRIAAPNFTLTQLREADSKIDETFKSYGHIMSDEQIVLYQRMKTIVQRQLWRKDPYHSTTNKGDTYRRMRDWVEKGPKEAPIKISRQKAWR